MGKISIGSALAAFPAFPRLTLSANATPEELQQLAAKLGALQLTFTDTSFTFTVPGALFNEPGAASYRFGFEGDFRSLAALPPEQLIAAFLPGSADAFQISFNKNLVTNLDTGGTVIGIDAGTTAIPREMSFLQFFATLLDPQYSTDDLLNRFFVNGTQGFDTLDLSAFTEGVIQGRPNGATIATNGTVGSAGDLVPSTYGAVSFNAEIDSITFKHLIGSAKDDVLFAGPGGLQIEGGDGRDILIGEAGSDVLSGGRERDILIAGAGDDQLSGDAGRDILVAGTGFDRLSGGSGRDVLISGDGDGVASGGSGADLFVVRQAAGTTLTITDFDARAGDSLDLSALGSHIGAREIAAWGRQVGDDFVVTIPGKNGQTIVFQDLGTDFRASVKAVSLGLARGHDDDARDDGLTIGTSASEHLRGTCRTDYIFAGAGNDRIDGGEGGDFLFGEAGNDTIRAGGGADFVYGGDGNDVINAGGGADKVFGGAGNDILRGQAGDDVLDGGDGNDFIIGGPGIDILQGGAGADQFVFQRAGDGIDRVTDFLAGVDKFDLSALLAGQPVTAANFDQYVTFESIGPTELSAYLSVDVDGGGDHFVRIAQFDGDNAFDVTTFKPKLTFSDFIV